MDALVLGGSGLVGERIVSELVRAGYSTSFTFFEHEAAIAGAEGHRLDVSDSSGLASHLKRLEPDLVVNTVALPSVDQCDKDPELAYRVNSLPQKIIAQNVKSGAAVAYMSTSNVFGISDKPLTEEDSPHPISTYGRMKLLGEQYALLSERHIILRSDQIYGWTKAGRKKTFVEKTMERLRAGETIEVCADWYNCPTFADDIARALVKLHTGKKYGTYHAVGPTYLNRFEWALRIAERFGYEKKLVRAIDSSSLNLPAKRSNCALGNMKIEKATGVAFLSVDEGLERMKATRNIPRP